MYEEANKRANYKHQEKIKKIPIVHFTNDDIKTSCNKTITVFMNKTKDTGESTCSVCRKSLGLPEIKIITENRFVSSSELRLRSRIETYKHEIERLKEQMDLAQFLLDNEITASRNALQN